MQRFRLVTFDITNTLLQFRTSVGEVYSQAGKKFGIESVPSELSRSFKKNFKTMLVEHPNFGATTGLSSESWWTQLVKRTFRHCNFVNCEDSQLTELAKYLFNAYETKEFWVVAAGSHALLQKLQESGIRLGVISNYDERLHIILREMGLRDYFDFVLASYLVGFEKPSVKIFDVALEKVGVEAKDAVHVGDNLELDYMAAKKAGWNAFLLTNKDCSASVCSDHIVKSIPELQRKMFSY